MDASQVCKNYKHFVYYKASCFERGGGGGGGAHQSFIRIGSARRSAPLPFHIPFLIEEVPLSYTFHEKFYTFHILTEGLLIISLEKPLKYLDESAVRCVCSKYFENPF